MLFRSLDATPSTWPEAERDAAPVWSPVTDALSMLYFEVQRRLGGAAGRPALALAVAGALYLVARRLRGGWDLRAAGAVEPAAPRQGLDSELYAVETAFAAKGLGRRPTETAAEWARRVGETDGRLAALAALHERLRFDPAGLPSAERGDLRETAAALIRWAR